MTPLYDVLSAQPSLEQHQISWRDLKLAMSVGKRPIVLSRSNEKQLSSSISIPGGGTLDGASLHLMKPITFSCARGRFKVNKLAE